MSKQLTNVIGKNLKAIRLQRGLAQVDMAVEIGMNSNYYGKLERGYHGDNMHMKTFIRLVTGLKVQGNDLDADFNIQIVDKSKENETEY